MDLTQHRKIQVLSLQLFNAVFSILRTAIDATALHRALGLSLLASALWLILKASVNSLLRIRLQATVFLMFFIWSSCTSRLDSFSKYRAC